MTGRERTLISAYACEPGSGSEAGIGWNWVEQAARFSRVWVITRASNRAAIERHVADAPLPGVEFVYYDLPSWARWWKKGSRGVHLYYVLWQLAIFFLARRLHARIGFDRTHHVTWGTYWMPSFLALLPIPLIWGPVGGGESGPPEFRATFSFWPRLQERLRDGVRSAARWNPAVRFSARRAAVALATTTETAARLRSLCRREVPVVSHVALPARDRTRLARLPVRTGAPFRLLSIGRLVHWKGFHLGIEAFEAVHRAVPGSEYWVVGDGPERRRLELLVAELDLTPAVRFLGRVPRDRVLELLGECDVLVHPSLHDSGGYACAEALAAGRPVICLDLGGPATLVDADCGMVVPADHPRDAVRSMTEAMLDLAASPARRILMAAAARDRADSLLNWERKGDLLRTLYSTARRPLPEPGAPVHVRS